MGRHQPRPAKGIHRGCARAGPTPLETEEFVQIEAMRAKKLGKAEPQLIIDLDPAHSEVAALRPADGRMVPRHWRQRPPRMRANPFTLQNHTDASPTPPAGQLMNVRLRRQACALSRHMESGGGEDRWFRFIFQRSPPLTRLQLIEVRGQDSMDDGPPEDRSGPAQVGKLLSVERLAGLPLGRSPHSNSRILPHPVA